MTAYYNEFDRYAAKWLRNLIAAGHIAPGDVDERSIEDVRPADLVGYRQCHFFAGIGVWSYALRAAGWPDDREVWTGSCPCQPFSAAGEGEGFDDERHLWPHFFHLIEQRRPAVLLGEQVASKDANAWIDLVQDDLEGVGYRVGAVAFPSAGIGAPHIRDRLYWVANTDHAGLEGRLGVRQRASERLAGACGVAGGLADPAGAGWRPERPHGDAPDGAQTLRAREAELGRRSATCGLADAHGGGRGDEPREQHWERLAQLRAVDADRPAGPVNGLWRAADWLLCRDGKWRAVEPGTFPLAHGAPARVGRLRAYGNAINAEAARIFVECVSELITP